MLGCCGASTGGKAMRVQAVRVTGAAFLSWVAQRWAELAVQVVDRAEPSRQSGRELGH